MDSVPTLVPVFTLVEVKVGGWVQGVSVLERDCM